MTNRLLAVALMAAMSWPGPAAVAQEAPLEDEGKTGVFVTLGLGVGHPFGAAGQLGLTVANVGRTDIILRAFSAFEYELFDPSDDVSDLAVLVGRRLRGTRGWLRGAAGLGRVSVTRYGEGQVCNFFVCEEYDPSNRVTVGLALQGDAMWTPLPWLGLGLTVLGDVNKLESAIGLTLGVSLGRLR